MPTTYAHDLFGKNIYPYLPGDLKKIIRKNQNLFRIGLHGPDILFYYMTRPTVTGTGIGMHHEDGAHFFERGMTLVRQNHDEKLLAYLMGFGCHYLLDSACHPYIEDMAAKKVITHTLLEKEFDRMLMLKTGKDPYHYYPARHILPRISDARVIHRAIPRVSVHDILTSLRCMKFITDCLVYDNKGRRRKLLSVLSAVAGRKLSASMMEYFMQKDPVPGSAVPVHTLYGLYRNTLKEAPSYLKELYQLSHKETHLSSRWHLTYNG